MREALINAALAAVTELGPERFTLRDVARRAGVSPAAPYRHFADKDALLAAVAEDCSQRLGATMDAAVARAGDDPVERYRATGIAYVRFAVEHPAHFRAINMPGVMVQPPQGMLDWMAEERRRVEEAQRDGKIVGLPIDHVMLAARCMMHGLASLIVDGQDGLADLTPAQAEQIAHAVTEVFGCGLLPRPCP